MIKEDTMEALHEAFCNELKEIRSRLEDNGGHFKCDREIDNAKDCIKAIRDLMKIESYSVKSVMR